MILLLSTTWAASLSGTVTTVDGTPIPSVDVVAYDTRLNYASARTTSDGAYAVGMLPPGRYRVRALPPDTDPRVDRFLPDAWDFCDADVIEVAEGDVLDGLDIALPEGGRLTGRVLSAAGEPVPSAQVLALGMSDRAALVSRSARADADGAFEIVGLDSEPGASEPYAVYVGVTGWPRQYLAPAYDEEGAAWFDVAVGDTTDLGDQPLLDGISVAGTVTGPDGPVASGTAYVYSSSQVLSVSIGADGTYLADGLPPGEVITWAASDGLATTYWPDVDRPGERIDALEEGTALTGADLSLPDESTLTVQLVGEGDLSAASVLLYNDTLTVGRGGSLAADGTTTIGALHPGTYYLFVYGADVGFVDDYVRDGADVRPVVVEGATELTVEMPVGASFSGTVRGDDGEPVYGAYVYATSLVEGDTVVAVTDADGAYRIDGLPGGDFTLRASYAHYCPNDPGW
ncbi:MAG: carboxypeptidase regulatory-like domain-containing protein, partial [Myxococcota bacterium]